METTNCKQIFVKSSIVCAQFIVYNFIVCKQAAYKLAAIGECGTNARELAPQCLLERFPMSTQCLPTPHRAWRRAAPAHAHRLTVGGKCATPLYSNATASYFLNTFPSMKC